MDSTLALALLSFGIFMGVLFSSLFYVAVIRPSLLNAATAESPAPVVVGNQVEQLAQTSAQLQASMTDLSRQVTELASRIEKIKPPPQSAEHLADIKGIGPVYSGLLHEAGIHTFEQLAVLTPEELYVLLDVPDWRRFNAEEWIEEAKLLASLRNKLGSDH